MITAWKERIRRKKLDNKGSAIVVVILALAFVGMLIAMLVYMVYYNYLMKYTDRAAKDNFYSAETALNEIQAGLVRDVSDALLESYSKVTKENYDDTAVNQQVIFENLYKQKLNDKLEMLTVYMGPAVGSQLKYSVDHLESYLEEPYKSAAVLDYEGTANQGGVNIRYGNANYSDGVLILEDVRVSYTNPDGYVSIIETDIAIETPELTFNSIQDVPQIENYSLIAADTLTTGIVEDKNTIVAPARVTVDGNVFGGDDGIYVNGDGYIKFVKNANDSDAVKYTLTAATINAMDGYRRGNVPPATASVDVTDAYSVWAEDLYAESAYMNIHANCFIRDDLTLDGLYPKVELSGKYNGYGNADVSAKNSSAILVNGAHSTLDFGGVEELWLAGGAYVGSAHYNANETTLDYINEPLDEYYERVDEEIANNERDEDTVSRNGTDVLMGQSLGVKPDQIMYMVPEECMGYEGDEQVLAKNPMTIEEYNKLFGTFVPLTRNGQTVIENGEIQYSNQLVYTPVRLDVIMNKVGGTANSYGASYVPVFRRINGTILVYFYLDFANQDMANKFFRDYYAADKEAFDRYFKTYIRSFTWNNSLGSNSSPLSIAGNMLYMNGGNNATVRLIEDTTLADITKADAMYDRAESYYIQYTGLSKYLMSTSAGLSAEQLKNSVFDNIIVNDTEFSKLVSDGHFKVFENADQSLKAILVNNDGGYNPFEINDERAANCALVIARGDVVVSAREFHGLIISGGQIRISQTCQTISYDSANVKKSMILKNADGKYVFEAVVNGAAYVNVIGGDPDLANAVDESLNNGVVTADRLVKFRNWNKE